MRYTLICSFVVAACSSPGLAQEPVVTEEPVWELAVGFHEHIFGSFIVGTATVKVDDCEDDEDWLGDSNGQIGIAISAPADHTPIKLKIECGEVMEPAEWEGELPKGGQVYSVRPKVAYRFEALLKNRQQIPVNVKATLQIGKKQWKKLKVATLRSINDCPMAVTGGVGEPLQDAAVLRWMYAAYVNEDHPWIDQLLKDALGTGIVKNFIGYQGKSDDSVLDQVFSIWKVLQQRNVTYSSISVVSAIDERVPSQHVRFLDESITYEQANCIDGTVVFASALRKIGLDPFLVVVPGHAYLAFNLDKEGTHMSGLETTLLGEVSKSRWDAATTLDKLVIGWKPFDEASKASFVKALQVGTKNLEQHAAKLRDAKEPLYEMVDVGGARKAGVKPLPYLGKEKLEGVKTKPARNDAKLRDLLMPEGLETGTKPESSPTSRP